MPTRNTQKNQGEMKKDKGWLYGYIMRDIEPDLLLEVADLEKKYAGESPISHAARMERYREAFAEFDRVVGPMILSAAEDVQLEKRRKKKAFGIQEATQRVSEVSTAEQDLDAFPSAL